MDLTERVERACAAMRGEAAWAERTASHGMMANIDRAAVLDGLRAAFPELFANPPTHWLAPVEVTPAMEDAVDAERDPYATDSYVLPSTAWAAFRNAYLSRKPGGAA